MTTTTRNTQTTCPRCAGTGNLTEYFHVRDGVCFKCNGTGKVNAPRVAKVSAAAVAKKAEKQAAVDAKYAVYQMEVKAAMVMFGEHPSVKNGNPNFNEHLAWELYKRAEKGW